MVKRIVVGAHYGLRDWLIQRITAIVMAIYTLLLSAQVLTALPMTFATWRSLFASPAMRVVTMFFLLSLFYHAWIGMRDILMDYVQPTGIRLTLEVVVVVALLLYALWGASILWG